jgi:hypothetical protein
MFWWFDFEILPNECSRNNSKIVNMPLAKLWTIQTKPKYQNPSQSLRGGLEVE